MPRPPTALPVDQLRWRCPPTIFEQFRSAGRGAPALIGQPRAIEALRLGLAINSPGYNIFVCGPSGTGKMSTVRALLREGAPARGPLVDYAYVQDFADPDRPVLLSFAAGRGRLFKRRVQGFVEHLAEQVRGVLEVESVDQHRRSLGRECEDLEESLLSTFEARCQAHRFELAQIQIGDVQHIDVMPIYKRKPIDIDDLNDIARSGGRVPRLAETNRVHGELKEELRAILVQLRRAARETQEKITQFEGDTVREALEGPIGEIKEEFADEAVHSWLDALVDWVVERIDLLREERNDEDDVQDHFLRGLGVNVVLDQQGQKAPPVVFENSPTFTNLLGTVERRSDETRATVHFSDIKAGSLLRANGGYLVINANDAVTESGVWRCLTRVLKTRELEIQSPEQYFQPGGGAALKPAPIPVDVKVIAVGDDELYRILYSGTDDFRRVFKLKADFDDVLERNPENLAIYARHAWRVIDEEGLLPIGDEALARLVEFGVRLAGRREWLSARFSDITDVIREASHYAAAEGAAATGVPHVEQALWARRRRHGLTEDRLRALVRKGVLNLITDGDEIGAANALTVLDIADHAFGQPCRITATCAPGHDGLMSVEREVRLSGRLHDKGTLILGAYLHAHYLPSERMALSATVTFEQMHDEVDGDSASVAESIALLSALAGVPVHQGIAITGAVDQRGRVLAVGGLNEKVEGFFHVCAERGLTGRQGVVLPADNISDLFLADDVIAAVEAKAFHIWAVRHLDEVIELATGQLAGAPEAPGVFPHGSFNERVRERLMALTTSAGERP